MGSTRLPNKMMLHLHGLPVVAWVSRRLRQSSLVDDVVFALPSSTRDDVVAQYLESDGVSVYRGSESDVLSRYFEVATKKKAEYVVRVCGDNPFVSASEVDRLIKFFKSGQYDYAYNHIPKGNCYPDGLGAEITTYAVLASIHSKATRHSDREHIFNYVWRNSCDYALGTFDPTQEELRHPHLKLDIDTLDDYAKLARLSVSIDSTAAEIVAAALGDCRRVYESQEPYRES